MSDALTVLLCGALVWCLLMLASQVALALSDAVDRKRR